MIYVQSQCSGENSASETDTNTILPILRQDSAWPSRPIWHEAAVGASTEWSLDTPQPRTPDGYLV